MLIFLAQALQHPPLGSLDDSVHLQHRLLALFRK